MKQFFGVSLVGFFWYIREIDIFGDYSPPVKGFWLILTVYSDQFLTVGKFNAAVSTADLEQVLQIKNA